MNIQMNLFAKRNPYGIQKAQNSMMNQLMQGQQADGTAKNASNAGNTRRMVKEALRQPNSQNAAGSNAGFQTGNALTRRKSVVEESLGYADSLSASRTKSKEAALQVKKLKYSYKAISSQIMSSKTSSSARQVVGKARREVLRLKRLQQNSSEKYDEEELQAAIAHAKSMEQIAKKKVRHLEEEEMARIASGPCMEKSVDMEEREKDIDEEQLTEEERMEAFQEQADEIQELLEEEAEIQIEQMQEITEEERDAMMDAFAEEMQQAMEELLEESGLEDLLGESVGFETDMDPADLKMLKIKHRTKEMKDIAKADAEYLKVIFKQLESGRSGGNISMPAVNSFDASVGDATISVSVPQTSASSGVGFDVSI